MSVTAVTVPAMTTQLARAEFPDCHGCCAFRAGPPAVCLACARHTLDVPSAASCPVCSQSPRADGTCANELCRRPDRRIGRIHAIGYQSGALRRVVNSYKYRGTRSWSVILGRLLLAWLEENLAGDQPGLIVANPGYAGPGGQPFGHAEAVLAAAATAAAAAAADAGGGAAWPFDAGSPAAIVKTGPTLRSADAQAWSKRVSGNELRGVLRIPDRARTAGKFVLVYDDICTTGTQLDEVAGCLVDQGGAARVEGIVLARALWRSGGLRAG